VAKENRETLMRVQPPNTSGWLCCHFCVTWLYYRSEMPRIWQTDNWPIRNGKYHKEVVWYERLTVNFKDLQSTLSLAPIEAFPNGDASKKGRRWRVLAMWTRGFWVYYKRPAHLDSLVACWLWWSNDILLLKESYLRYWLVTSPASILCLVDTVFSCH
jgi:hypothetical protein